MYLLRKITERPAIKSLFLLLVFLAGNQSGHAQDPDHPNRVSLVTYGFGEMTPNGFRYLPRPRRIKAVLGARFGTDYMMLGPAGKDFYYTKVWVYPHPIADPKTGDVSPQLNIDMHEYGNQRLYAGFILEYPQEVMKGRWSLQFYYKGRMIKREDFELY